jgi:hypothetical protein
MIFSASDFTKDQNMSPDSNKEQRFAALPPEPSSQNKSMKAHNRIPLDLANSRHNAHRGVHQRSLQKLNTSAKTRKTGLK